MLKHPALVGMVLVLGSVGFVAPALAGQGTASERVAGQSQRPAHARGWQVDVYSGGTFGQSWGRGEGQLPPGGEPVTFALSVPTVTRLIPSWFFGPGIALMDEVNASGWLSPNGLLPITEAITNASVRPGNGWLLGVRVNRPVRDRLTLDLDVSVTSAGLGFTRDAMETLDGSRAAFEDFWGSVEERVGQTERTAQAVLLDAHKSSKEVRVTGGLRFRIKEWGQHSLYASAAPGIASTVGGEPHVALIGRYRINQLGGRTPTLRPHEETDSVSISAHAPRVRLIATMAAGWERSIFRSIGLGVEARMTISPSVISMTVDAVPERLLIDDIADSGILILGIDTPPGEPRRGVVFDNNHELSLLFPSSLSGPPLREFQTHATRGLQTSLGVTARIHYRFGR